MATHTGAPSAQGLTWAADHGARVANISYVGVAASSTVKSAAQYMRNKGGVVAVSAGNNGIDEGIASTTEMIVVSATDSADAKTSWSSYGSFVDLAAPGQSIYTTARGGGYQYWSGTSLASPIVAGVAALVKALRPDFTAAQVESAIFASAVDLGTAGQGLGLRFRAGQCQAAVGRRHAADRHDGADRHRLQRPLAEPSPGQSTSPSTQVTA